MKDSFSATILVTGGAGFIGSNFIKLLFPLYPKIKIICLDALTYAGNKENLKGLPKNRFVFVKGDIADYDLVERIFKRHRPSYIINFAAETHVDRSIHGKAADFIKSNVLGVEVLLSAARKLKNLEKFIQISTDEVYGELPLRGGKKFSEKSPLLPNSPYAASKAAGDLIARSFFETYKLPVIITRCSNNYGPNQYPEKLIPFSISRLLGGKPMALYGDGKYVRDWIHVEDHCRALALVLFKGEAGKVYNIGGNDEISNLELADRLACYFKRGKEAIVFVKDRPGHDRRYAIDASKIKKELGWKPKHTFEKSFFKVVKWYVDNQKWMKKIMNRVEKTNSHIQ